MSLKVKIGADVAEFMRATQRVRSELSSLGSAAMKYGSIMGGAALAGVTAFGVQASKLAMTAETTAVAFEVLAGSADKAGKLIKDMRAFEIETPLGLEEIHESAKTMMGFGIALEDVMPLLRNLGDLSLGSAERLKGLAFVIGQIGSVGRLQGQDLNQMTQRGFNPLNYIAKRTGETMLQLRKRMEDGKISFAEVKVALKDATSEGGAFNNMLTRMGKTTEGQMAKVKGEITMAMTDLGKAVNVGVLAAAKALNQLLSKMGPTIKQFSGMLGTAIQESVNGDSEKLVRIGQFIGDLITAGFKISTTGLWRDFGAGVMKLPTYAMGEDRGGDLRGKIDQNRNDIVDWERETAIAEIAKKYADLVTNNQGVREYGGSQFTGMPADAEWKALRDKINEEKTEREKSNELLRSIDRKLTPSF